MDSFSMMGSGRRPVFLTPSSSHHLHHTQGYFPHNGIKNGVGAAGTACLPSQHTVAILGSGDFSKCLTIRLLRCGFHVVVGSRHPKQAAQSFPHVVDVTHHEDAVGKANIMFLAIRREHYSILWDLKHLLEGKQHHTYTLRTVCLFLSKKIVVIFFKLIFARKQKSNGSLQESRQACVYRG